MKVFLCLALFATVAFAEPPLYRQQQQQRYFFARQQEEAAASGPYPARGWRPSGPEFNLPQRQQQVDNAYGPPQQQPQQQYGPPQQQQPQQQYGPPKQAQQQYGPPQAEASHGQPQQFGRQRQQPQQQYGAPAPQSQYGAPAKQQQYGAPAPQEQYGAPVPQEQYGAPAPQEQYGAPEYTTTEVPNSTEFDEPTTVGGLNEPESERVSSVKEFEEEELENESNQQNTESDQRGEYYVALPDGRLQRVRYVSRQDLEAMRYFAKIRAENVEPLRGPIYAYSPLQKLQVAPGNLQVAVAPVVSAVAPVVSATGLTVTATESKPQKLIAPRVDIKPLTQVQIQHDNAVPLSSSYATYTANYQVPEERYILAFP